MPEIMNETVTLVKIECGECAIPFAIPQSKYYRAKTKGEDFHCPNGHTLVYRTTDNQRLKEEITRLTHRAEQSEAETQHQRDRSNRLERRNAAQRGVTTRVKNRIKVGLCPCCRRNFKNLKRHMDTKHPNYTKEKN